MGFPASLNLWFAQVRISVSTMGVPSGLNLDSNDNVYFLINCQTEKQKRHLEIIFE